MMINLKVALAATTALIAGGTVALAEAELSTAKQK
jgi:hypothetical protein